MKHVKRNESGGTFLGIAIVGTVVTSSVSGNLMNHLPTSTASKLALSAALQHGFLAVLVFALIALVATFFLKEAHLKETLGVMGVVMRQVGGALV